MIDAITTVTVAAADTTLVDIRDVREELGITDTASDSKLARWIAAESARFAAACNRTFPVETLSEQIRLDYTYYPSNRRPDVLPLTRFPVVSISSVTEDDSATALDASYYEANDASGQLYRLDGNGNRICWAACKVVVVYQAGYATIPQDVQDAVITLVRHRWFSAGRDPSLRALTIDGVSTEQFWVGAVGDVGDLPPEVEAVASRYREIPI